MRQQELSPLDQVGVRTCAGCGGKKHRRELLRFTAMEGVLIFDEKQRLPGRGVYCCRQSGCLGKFLVRKRQVSKVLRQEVTDCRAVSTLREELFGSALGSLAGSGKEVCLNG